MQDARQQRLLRLVRKRLVLLILLGAFLLLIPSVWSAFGKEQESRANRLEAETQLAGLKAQQAALSSDVAKLKTDRGVEDALRHRYDVAGQGEGVIYVVDQQATATAPADAHQGFFGWLSSLWPF
jgi:cell division protein FtsB